MDSKQATFRNLVTNKYMENFNYGRQEFSFETLFYQSSFSYCCCSCGFENEYLVYISEDGNINEDIYQKILNSTLSGKCPHVGGVEQTYVRDTVIYASHIAAAVGTIKAVENISRKYLYRTGSIYNLDPLQIAIMKNRCDFVKRYQVHLKAEYLNKETTNLDAGPLIYATRAPQSENCILFETISEPTFCIRTRNLTLLKIVLDPMFCRYLVHEDFDLIYAEALTDMQKELLSYIRVFRCHDRVDILTKCAISAIVYEQDSDLQVILQTLKTCGWSSQLTQRLPDICDLLGKTKQKEVVGSYDYIGCPADDHFRLATIHHLIQYSNEYFNKLKEAFNTLDKGHGAINDAYNNSGGFTPLHECVDGLQHDVDPHRAKILLKYGADIDICNNFQQTPLLTLLQGRNLRNIQNFRHALVLLISENPDVTANASAVEDGITLDQQFAQERHFEIAGNYIMDATEHTCFSDEDFALNFIGPLLIECGFYYSTDTLINAQKRHSLHHTEKEYLNYFLENPRSLKLSCRDVLRRHFKRRAIDEFVNNVNIPQKIKDYILIKSVLCQSQALH